MNKKELIDAIAAKTDSSKAQAERTVQALLEVISETLQKGESITLQVLTRLKCATGVSAQAAIPRSERN
jgi:nucleoid DNA-binding protein